MKAAPMIYARRPDSTPVWLPPDVLEKVGAKAGATMTAEQFGSRHVQEILATRRAAEGKKKSDS